MNDETLSGKRYIIIVLISLACVIVAVCVYLSSLSKTVSQNLMSTVDEITSHDIETIEGSLNDAYARLDSVAIRMNVYDIDTTQQMQEQLNLEAASSAVFNAIYMMAEDGSLYSSTYVVLDAEEHTYQEQFENGRTHFAMLYDDANGLLETNKESLIYGIKLDDLEIGGVTFVAMLGRSDLGAISNQLMIDSFDGAGYSSVVNYLGYYIVGDITHADLAGRNNFFKFLEAAQIEDGVTVNYVRDQIEAGESFVITCITPAGERMVFSFAPVEGTQWSFIMAVPYYVFEQRFAPFINMTVGMLVAVVVLLAVMMGIIYKFMKRSVVSNAESAARAEFLSNMSHEIRTPLNGIIGLNHLMVHHIDDKEAMAGYLKKLGKAAQYLLSLVNDILDVSKLQAGKIELDHSPFDLQSALDNVCEMQRETIAGRGIDLIVEGLPLEYPYLIGDEVRVSQVFMNILSNAAKFTPEGGTIKMTVFQRRVPDSSRVTSTVSIADTGCGMTPEFREHIFDAFSQERNSNSESQKGTGLGMSISHLLITEMGGKLSVESELGVGSTFTAVFTLPIDTKKADESPRSQDWHAGGTAVVSRGKASEAAPNAQNDAEAPRELSASEAGGEASVAHNGTMSGEASDETSGALGEAATGHASSSKPESSQAPTITRAKEGPIRILIAEDNALNAEILYSILTEEGFEADIATDGQEAVDMFSSSAPGCYDIILMDAQMPEKDGYTAAREIRRLKREDADSVVIFACTASTFSEDRVKAMDSGMNGFLPKPLDFKAVLAKLREYGNGGTV